MPYAEIKRSKSTASGNISITTKIRILPILTGNIIHKAVIFSVFPMAWRDRKLMNCYVRQ